MRRIPTTADMVDHVRSMAVAFNVLMVEADCYGIDVAWANISQRSITIPHIVDDVTYAIALHEMGHILAPGGFLGLKRSHLEEEENAWDWAHHYALDWTPAMEQVRVLTLATYGG